MELTHRFTVPASIDVAWAAFNDLAAIAPCFPGATVSTFDGEEFTGACKVKLGPISLLYTGTGRFVERDESAYRAVVEAKGKDKRGNGTATASVTALLHANDDNSTAVSVTTELAITGKPAQFGRGVIQDVSDKLLGQFAACLETKLAGSTDPEPATSNADPAAGMPGDATAPPASSGPATPQPAASRPEALDVGATLVPILARRYAPYLIGVVVALLLVRRLWARR
jgi:uncharacterized protein